MPDPPDLGFQLDDDAWLQQARAALEPDSWNTIGDFEILEEVSRGGQGVVLRARRTDGTLVAVKRLIAGTLTGTRGRIRFEREMEIAARLDHPGIVPLLQRAILDRQPLLVMPWVEGIPPDRWARPNSGRPRTRREIVGLLLRICDAVSHAHQRGVIHRDLKPSNILVDDKGMPHVLDFGIGKLLLEDAESARQLTLTTEFLGSPTYAPPERLLSTDTPSDVRDDVYSLGILLYNLLANAEPYPFGSTLASAIRAIQEQEPIPLRRHDAAIERDLAAVVHMAISKEPERRYASVAELRADLQRFQTGDAVAAHPPSRLYGLKKAMRRNPAASVFACLSLGLILGFGAYAGWQAKRLASQRNDAYQARGDAKEEAARTHDALGFLTEELIGQLDPKLRGRVASVPEILRDASADIGTRFGDDPDLEAEVRLAIGRMQLLNGDYRGAGDQLALAQRRLEDAEADGFEVSPTLQRELFLVTAEVHLQRAAYAPSEQALDHAEALSTPSTPRSDAFRLARLRIRLAMARGQVAQAESLCLAHRSSLPVAFDEERWQTDLLLVSILRSGGQAQASVDLARSLIDRWHANSATPSLATPTSPPTIALANATRAWGWSLFHAGQLSAAEAPLREALDLRRQLLGRTHPDVAQSLMDIAIWSQFFGRDPAVIRTQFEEAVAILRSAGAANQNLMAGAWSGLAGLATDAGDFEEAARLYREAMDLLADRLGAEHPVLAGLYLDRGLMEMQRNAHDAARDDFTRAGQLMAPGGHGHQESPSLWMAMARNEEAAGEAVAAIGYFRQAADMLAVQKPEGCRPMLVCLKRIAALHEELGQAMEATTTQREASEWEARMAQVE